MDIMNPDLLITAIAPVLLLLAMGFAAGKTRHFDPDQNRGFSQFALTYSLPVALFLGMAGFDRHLLLAQGPIILVMVIGYSAFFAAGYGVLRALRQSMIRSTLLAYAVSSTAAPIYGLTVLEPIYGATISSGVVGLAAVVTNLVQVSVVVYMLQAASQASGTATAGLGRSLWHTVRNPLVWAPVLGALLSLDGQPPSPMLIAILHPLAVCAPGIAIFACGLALAAYPLKLGSRTAILGSLICIVIQPAVFFAGLKLLDLHGPMAQATLVASAMATSTPSALFAQQYGACQTETATIMLLSTLGMTLSIPLAVLVSHAL